MLVSLSCYVASHGTVAEQEEDRIVFSLFPLNLQTKDLIHTITITLLMTAGEIQWYQYYGHDDTLVEQQILKEYIIIII